MVTQIIEEVDVRTPLFMHSIIRVAQKVKTMDPDEVFVALTDDASMLSEIPHYCNITGNELVRVEKENGFLRFYIRKSPLLLKTPRKDPLVIGPARVDEDPGKTIRNREHGFLPHSPDFLTGGAL